MVEAGPLTPGQISFVLGFIPVFTTWLYSEVLEFRKTFSPLKICCSHSNTNLMELGNERVKEGDHVMLLEGGLSNSASQRIQSTSLRTTLIRFAAMDESFLSENRSLLRAMSEFGGLLVYFFVCDRTNLFPEISKSYSRDLFLFLYLLLIIASP
ncbi:hypothetical protein HPP92_020288 [Vanilla planifolia]|uniref:Cas1p 10 TM acyl transferase domain-containing protein n=1 Tax=Vanilla planifolia TaxID=51239 RepID=A0A835Q6Y2_VANPL|nr:hypothetical protein HPP92_020288 [Vanilla planifolia]